MILMVVLILIDLSRKDFFDTVVINSVPFTPTPKPFTLTWRKKSNGDGNIDLNPDNGNYAEIALASGQVIFSALPGGLGNNYYGDTSFQLTEIKVANLFNKR